MAIHFKFDLAFLELIRTDIINSADLNKWKIVGKYA